MSLVKEVIKMAAISVLSGLSAVFFWLLTFLFLYMGDECPGEGCWTASILAGLFALGLSIVFIGYTF